MNATEAAAFVRPARFEVDADNKIKHADFGEPDLADNLMEALDHAHQQVYFAARRYIAAFERYEIDFLAGVNPNAPSLGSVAHDLAHEVGHYSEVYGLLESTGYFLSDEEHEPEEADQVTIKL